MCTSGIIGNANNLSVIAYSDCRNDRGDIRERDLKLANDAPTGQARYEGVM
jgi:hypothetical protein